MATTSYASATDRTPALHLVRLTALMTLGDGSPEVRIGIVDGPVSVHHPGLTGARIVPRASACTVAGSMACRHATFIAGILAGTPDASPALCPGCTLLVRPIFFESAPGRQAVPTASAAELSAALVHCMDLGARVVNLSLTVRGASPAAERELHGVLDQAARRGVIVVAAAGNLGIVPSSVITRHPWVVPVVACDLRGRPLDESNLSASIARQGLRAPGDGVASLCADGAPTPFRGTSVAAPFVTGTIALLWSQFPSAAAEEVKLATTHAFSPRRTSIVPPLLNAAASYRALRRMRGRLA